jgi:uncharacterized repeat protein (TIGR01451 family)
VGDVINYTLEATNDGNVPLTNVSITDVLLGALSCSPTQPAPLAVGQKLTCSGSHTIVQADLDAGKVDNTANAQGQDPSNAPVTAQAKASVPAVANPQLSLSKSGALDMTIVAPADRPDAGDVINYTLTAQNTGNVSLNGVTISDPLLGSLTCSPTQPSLLAPNASLV